MGLKPQTIQVYVNAKAQLIRIVDMEKNGKTMQMHSIVSFDIDTI